MFLGERYGFVLFLSCVINILVWLELKYAVALTAVSSCGDHLGFSLFCNKRRSSPSTSTATVKNKASPPLSPHAFTKLRNT